MTYYENWYDDPEAWEAFERKSEEMNLEVIRFEDEYRASIARKLGRIDRLRQQLIDAQNDLGSLLSGVGDYTREVFASFYHNGGVTEADWKVFSTRRGYPETIPLPPARDYGQLRVVRGNRQPETPAPKTTPRWRPPGRPSGDDDGPRAA